MIHSHTYYIKFRRNGKPESQTKRYQAANPGHAFWKCHQRDRNAALLATPGSRRAGIPVSRHSIMQRGFFNRPTIVAAGP